jgi:hypothetical protein
MVPTAAGSAWQDAPRFAARNAEPTEHGPADLAQLPDLLGCETVEQVPADSSDVPRRRGGERGETLLRKLRERAAPVLGARLAPDPSLALQPRDRV